jgi:hypothetical protein
MQGRDYPLHTPPLRLAEYTISHSPHSIPTYRISLESEFRLRVNALIEPLQDAHPQSNRLHGMTTALVPRMSSLNHETP